MNEKLKIWQAGTETGERHEFENSNTTAEPTSGSASEDLPLKRKAKFTHWTGFPVDWLPGLSRMAVVVVH